MSWVWKYIQKSPVVQCKVDECDQVFKSPHTSTLSRHLTDKHGLSDTVKKVKTVITGQIVQPPPSSSTITGYYHRITKKKSNEIDRKLVNFICQTSSSLSIVHQEAFMEFCSLLSNSYTLPSRRKLTKLISQEVNQIKESKLSRLKKAKDISLTADSWCSKNSQVVFFVVTVHYYIEGSEERHNEILDLVEMIGSKDTVNYTATFNSILKKYEIDPEQVVGFTGDGEKALSNAATGLFSKRHHCFSHVLNLVVRNSMQTEEVSLILAKLRRAVSSINKSDKLRRLFVSFCENHSLPKIIPKSDIVTRWNYTYLMLCDVLHLFPAVQMLLNHLKMVPLDDDEKKLLEFMKEILQPFHQVTNEVSDGNATLSMIVPRALLLKTKCEMIYKTSKRECKDFAKALVDNCKKYLDKLLFDPYLMEALIFDPRYSFNNGIFAEAIWDATMRDIVALENHEVEDDIIEDRPIMQKPQVHDMWGDFLVEPPRKKSKNVVKNALKCEFLKYKDRVTECRPARYDDLYRWWLAHRSEFPLLFPLFLKTSVTPATSVDSERMFRYITYKNNI